MQWRERNSFDSNSTEGPPSSVVILNSLLSILLLEWNCLSSCFSWHCVSRSSVSRVTAEPGGFQGEGMEWRPAMSSLGSAESNPRSSGPSVVSCPQPSSLLTGSCLFWGQRKKILSSARNSPKSPSYDNLAWDGLVEREIWTGTTIGKKNNICTYIHVTNVCCLFLGPTRIKKNALIGPKLNQNQRPIVA